ncbi:MAG: hypothetical protein PHH80_01010 [Sphaerochaetaceae bacterium]|nr:hypothetical protein [Sphaerochaetaceae bacterium]
MKKFLVLVILVALVATSAFADPFGSGSLNVYGLIGDGTVNFVVNGIEYSRVDLINNATVQSDGVGVQIGSWTMTATNQVLNAGYTVTYTYSPLAKAGDDVNLLAYEILEIDEVPDPDTSTVKATAATTALTMAAGPNTITRKVAFRLTAAGEAAVALAPPSDAYNSTVTIALSSN